MSKLVWVNRSYTVDERWLVKVSDDATERDILNAALEDVVGMEPPTDDDTDDCDTSVTEADAVDIERFGDEAIELDI